MRISDWSSDVCSSDLPGVERYVTEAGALQKIGDIILLAQREGAGLARLRRGQVDMPADRGHDIALPRIVGDRRPHRDVEPSTGTQHPAQIGECGIGFGKEHRAEAGMQPVERSEEHTSELKSLMRNSYADSCC